MMRLRLICCSLLVSLVVSAGQAWADDPSAKDQLKEAIKLFDAGDYQASADLLKRLDESALGDEDLQVQHQRYTSLCRAAIDGAAEAQRRLDEADAAMKAKDAEKAKRLLEDVLANAYASKDVKAQAAAKLKDLNVEAKPAAAPQKKLGQSSLLSQLAEEYDLLWQQAVRTYTDAEHDIRKAVLKEDFPEAHRLMDYAKQTLELNRRYASSDDVYESYVNQAAALESYIAEEERLWQEQEVQRKHAEIAERERERIERIAATKQRQINGLMDQASELRKEQRYEDAIQVLEQILTIDPDNDQAAWMRETLEDLAMAIRDRQAVRDRHSEIQGLLIENDEAMIPWHEHLRYPKNWPEISAKRIGEAGAAESEADRAVRRKLQESAPELRYDAQEFAQVIDNLRSLTGLNIVPNWMALEAAAIERDAEVSLRLSNVRFEKALALILEHVGAGETDLGYTIDEGVIQISTREDLSRKTLTRVYNVQDLLITVPTFRGRQINLDQVGQQAQEGGIGGGRYLQGQGGASQGSQGLFGGGGGGDEFEAAEVDDPLQPIIELIQNTIEPDSWRDAGGNVGALQSLNQQIVVTQTAAAHSQLANLLQELRRARALQIAVEARYITISRNWLEQIGVDLDVVLNSGNAGYDRTTISDPTTGNPVLVPRQFVRNGFTPLAPGGTGYTIPTQPFASPYGQPGMVPAVGDIGPHSSRMTPMPLVNNTMELASPSDTNIPGSLGSLVNQSPAFQVFGSFLDNIQVDFLLRASQVDRRSSDLDAPRLVLFNGQRATFEAFVEQDYIAALTPIIGDNAGAFLPNVDTALTGRSLDVQATVSADRRYVTMTVRTFTRVTGDFRTVFFAGSTTVGSGFVELATQTTQQIRTTVSVPDGGTLLIGGLKLSGERDVDAGVPILSRIPILKRAFSNTSNVKDDQILLILIKPTIIIQEEAEAEAFPTLSAMGR